MLNLNSRKKRRRILSCFLSIVIAVSCTATTWLYVRAGSTPTVTSNDVVLTGGNANDLLQSVVAGTDLLSDGSGNAKAIEVKLPAESNGGNVYDGKGWSELNDAHFVYDFGEKKIIDGIQIFTAIGQGRISTIEYMYSSDNISWSTPISVSVAADNRNYELQANLTKMGDSLTIPISEVNAQYFKLRIKDVTNQANGLNKWVNTVAIHLYGLYPTVRNITSTAEMVDDTDSRIEYGGAWALWDREGARDYNGTVHYTSSNGQAGTIGDYVSLNFQGSGVSAIMVTSAGYGIMEVFIDGISVGEYDTYSPSQKGQQVIYSVTNLPYGDHNIKLVHTGKSNPASTGTKTKLEFDAFKIFDNRFDALVVPLNEAKQLSNGILFGNKPGEFSEEAMENLQTAIAEAENYLLTADASDAARLDEETQKITSALATVYDLQVSPANDNLNPTVSLENLTVVSGKTDFLIDKQVGTKVTFRKTDPSLPAYIIFDYGEPFTMNQITFISDTLGADSVKSIILKKGDDCTAVTDSELDWFTNRPNTNAAILTNSENLGVNSTIFKLEITAVNHTDFSLNQIQLKGEFTVNTTDLEDLIAAANDLITAQTTNDAYTDDIMIAVNNAQNWYKPTSAQIATLTSDLARAIDAYNNKP